MSHRLSERESERAPFSIKSRVKCSCKKPLWAVYLCVKYVQTSVKCIPWGCKVEAQNVKCRLKVRNHSSAYITVSAYDETTYQILLPTLLDFGAPWRYSGTALYIQSIALYTPGAELYTNFTTESVGTNGFFDGIVEL